MIKKHHYIIPYNSNGVKMANIQYKFFSEIDLKDSFFDSLRQEYQGFDNLV